ncbi:hypothetical protein RhiirB3_419851 [Rhizophagus irregularis]|nr:hypothetical protein RhiirB3_419851 [Rhizophagus irregularis]
MSSLKFTSNLSSLLSQSLLNTLDNDEYYDITIEVGNDTDVKIFRAHMVILSCRSPYLRKILLANKKENIFMAENLIWKLMILQISLKSWLLSVN